MAHQRIQLVSRKTGSLSTALVSLRRTNGINSSDLNPLDYHVWIAMLEKYHNLRPKPKTIRKWKVELELIWEDLPEEPINKAIKTFQKNSEHLSVLMVDALNISCETTSSLFVTII